ncbi:hypothetical protein BGZ65_002415, partial [Modicella reniformis]
FASFLFYEWQSTKARESEMSGVALQKDLLPHEALKLANAHLENAIWKKDGVTEESRHQENIDLVLLLCDEALAAFCRMSDPTLKVLLCSKRNEDQSLRTSVAAIFTKHHELMLKLEQVDKGEDSRKMAELLGNNNNNNNPSSSSSKGQSELSDDTAKIPLHIFAENMRPPTIPFKGSKPGERIESTPQLAYCLGLLNDREALSKDSVEKDAWDWVNNPDTITHEKKRLEDLAMQVVEAFCSSEFKHAKIIAEVLCLAPVLEMNDFRRLVNKIFQEITKSTFVDLPLLQGFAQLIQSAKPGYLVSKDLKIILERIKGSLDSPNKNSPREIYQLLLTTSTVLDAMASAGIKEFKEDDLRGPLANYLSTTSKTTDAGSDFYLTYQVAYACKALQCIPDGETSLQKTLHRSGKVIQGVFGVVSAVKALDVDKLFDGLKELEKGFEGLPKLYNDVQASYKTMVSLLEKNAQVVDAIKGGFSFRSQETWYITLRGADDRLRCGELAEFKKVICRAPCRRNPLFQWGVCQRLGEVAANSLWDAETRQGAVAFLGEIYQKDEEWGQPSNIKQGIIKILMQLASPYGGDMQPAKDMLHELGTSGDAKKQELYRKSREETLSLYPMVDASLKPEASPLLDRIQNAIDVEDRLRWLKNQRSSKQVVSFYVHLEAKDDLESPNDSRSSLMSKVKEFLKARRVLLIMGEPGSGKSTFCRVLEHDLWEDYKEGDPIPLYIHLPTIQRPEQDLIPKCLRSIGLTEALIGELRSIGREFILICDGYDESKLTHNLYTSNRLGQDEEWKAIMVISCRTEYLGLSNRHQFHPTDCNNRRQRSLFQEAVIMPFSNDQVEDYIKKYVSKNQLKWQASYYLRAIERFPDLKDMVKNPLLLSLYFEVVTFMEAAGQHLAAARLTKVELYDSLLEKWLERSERRLGEKELSPQAKTALENLTLKGFTQSGIDYMKRLAWAIYKDHKGNPEVEYIHFKEEAPWKAEFFGLEEEKQLLREACPLTREGYQHRFIHRSLLEYGIAREVFDAEAKAVAESKSASGLSWSVAPVTNIAVQVDDDLEYLHAEVVDEDDNRKDFRKDGAKDNEESDEEDEEEELAATVKPAPDINSSLAKNDFVNEPSILQFLADRTQISPLFEGQLRAYIEQSKKNGGWRIAAANAITILVKAGFLFNGQDLREINVQGADLSNGMFNSALLHKADMRYTNVRNIWLHGTVLHETDMGKVRIGELPPISVDDSVAF